MHSNRTLRQTVWLVLLLFTGVGCCVWLFVWLTSDDLRYFVDSSGKPFTVIQLSATEEPNLQEMPTNSVALSTEGSIVAVKMANLSGDVMSRVWRIPSITSLWMWHCQLPDDIRSSPPFLQYLETHDCSMTDQSLLAISKPETLKSLHLINETLLTAGALSKVVDQNHLTHLTLWYIPSLESAHFSVNASSVNQLALLQLTGDTIDDAVLRQLSAGGNLRILFIDNTVISEGAVADALLANPKLEELVVSDCPISIETLRQAGTLSNLRNLMATHISADSNQLEQLRADLLLRHPQAKIRLYSARDQKK
ncbi:MAG: hypothetical protein KDA77_03080 [Planctomycetaceae bacterium]|nr:hypothetical protein [Planctomycetaceae bacterium]